MYYISDIESQRILTLNQGKVSLKKMKPRMLKCTIEGPSILLEERDVSPEAGRFISGEDNLPVGYSGIARWMRDFMSAFEERSGQSSQNVTISTRIIYSGRTCSRSGMESHCNLSLLRVARKGETGISASEEMLVDFEADKPEEVSDRAILSSQSAFSKCQREGNRMTNCRCLLPASLAAKIVRACMGAIVRFEEGGLGDDAPCELRDCQSYNGVCLCHSFDMVGQTCEDFDVLANSNGYSIRVGRELKTSYGTIKRDPWRSTLSSGPRAIVQLSKAGSKTMEGIDFITRELAPLYFGDFLSSPLLGFKLIGEMPDGTPAEVILRKKASELLGRLHTTNNISYFMCNGYLVGVGECLLYI